MDSNKKNPNTETSFIDHMPPMGLNETQRNNNNSDKKKHCTKLNFEMGNVSMRIEKKIESNQNLSICATTRFLFFSQEN